MHPSKAPGLDGFPPSFFQRYWNLIGDEVVAAVQSFLDSDELMRKVNDTLIVLIPKVAKPEYMQQLRPIALCNVIYKLGSKVLANRLKLLMDAIISPQQGAFVPGRLITDNSIIAYEIAHNMKQRRNGVGYCALKLDMSKAYDRVEWGFLEKSMRRLGFCEHWIAMIMRCVSTVRYSFLINGSVVGSLHPWRGLRQGDSLSPYLFLLCGEAFSQLIKQEERKGRWRGYELCKGAPSVSHLLFADDAFLFCRAETGDVVSMQGVLKAYELISGQVINFSKSELAFSHNVAVEDQTYLADLLGVRRVDNHDVYLGMPVVVGRSKAAAFHFLVEKVRARTDSWCNKTLSVAGRAVLLQAVIQAVPAYVMNCFEVPVSICDEIQRLMAKFWWGGSEAQRKIHWLSWDKLCRAKQKGGLGFRDLRTFNLALLAKQGWRLLENPESLVALLLKAKYFPSVSFMEAEIHQGASLIWRSIIKGRSILEMGLRHRIGDGKSTKVWESKWLPLPISFKPFSKPPINMENLMVEELIDEARGCWKETVLLNCFTNFEADIIRRIPLSLRAPPDRLVWHYEPKGIYTVRSGYRTARERYPILAAGEGGAGCSSDCSERAWKSIWGLDVPPKIRYFLWKLMSNCLPTRASLARRHMLVGDKMCLLCDEELEDADHLFRRCSSVQEVWRSVDLLEKVLQQPAHFLEWFFGMMVNVSKREFELFCICLWSIWNGRNKLLWQGAAFRPSMTASWSISYLSVYRSHHPSSGTKPKRPSTKWKCPPSGRLKANIDGAYEVSTGKGGVAVVVRDEHGLGIAAKARFFATASSALMMEVEGLRESLRLGIQQGFVDIDIECDSILLCSAMSRSEVDHSEFGLIVEDCKILLQNFRSTTIRHVYREANGAAHRLASYACKFEFSSTWLDSMPTIIHDVLFEELPRANNVNRSIGITSSPLFHDDFNINMGGT